MALPIPQLRHALRNLMPPWLDRTYGRSLTTEGFFTLYDLDADYMRDALVSRWPSYAPEDALALIARDRGVPVGPLESPDVLRVRLLLWIDFAQLAGLPIGLLIALQGSLSPSFPEVRVVTQASLWYTLAEGAAARLLALPGAEPLSPAPYESGALWPTGSPPEPAVERLRFSGLYERLRADPPNWDWDSLSAVAGSGLPWGAWVILYSLPPSGPFGPDGAWGTGGVWGDGGAWGVDQPTSVGQLLQTIVKRGKPARSWVRSIVVSFDGALFDPSEAPGGPHNPDGRFGRWSKIVPGTGWVASRFALARYSGGVL